MKELLRNSIKAIETHKGEGEIRITTYVESKASLEIGNRIVIEISDTGPGFPTNFPLFEPFQSTDPQSTGLGLATVKELVEAHRGKIVPLTNPDGRAIIRGLSSRPQIFPGQL